MHDRDVRADALFAIGFTLQQSRALKRFDRLHEPHRDLAVKILDDLERSGFIIVRDDSKAVTPPTTSPHG